ncbi:MAG TPA: chemotaxis protein CheW [Nitrospira sp.]|jgi:chemotaxis signal transduction protein|nr:chemotaxis protein CheW [Nitrospira sp.]
MLRAARQQDQAVIGKRSWNVVVFSVGGKKLAARTEDVGGVAPWIDPVPVPSRTPFVAAMLKREKDVMPVYDLATRLSREPEGDPLLCLVARHVDGPMAICIDGIIPSLHNVDIADIVPSKRLDLETLGSFTDEGQEIDIVAFQRLGRSRQDDLRS